MAAIHDALVRSCGDFSREDTTEQLHERIRDLSSKLQPFKAETSAHMSMPSHAVHVKKHGIEIYKMGKKLSKRVIADADTIYNYHMNLSVFSLMPDYWGIEQMFPMIPVSRLDEKPTHQATLVDITCDSDGKVKNFIREADTLSLHPLDPKLGSYYVAVLLSGAYQEVLSSKHNLFGGPSLVRVVGTDHGGTFSVETALLGPTTEELIGTMRYDVKHDISSVIEEWARDKKVWEMVEKLVENGLHTMPYLLDYKPPPTV
uniref:Uncharacterized protein n=1 Tax=Avena sativa TaxID=4498 RepID=A0ACD5WNW9_AVESA